MVQKLIAWSLQNRIMVLLAALGLLGWGFYSVRQNPIDAIPDLSENQVIVFTEWQGRSPQIIEDQVTYPLVSNLQGIPKVKNVRGTSMFGMRFVYIIFDDNVLLFLLDWRSALSIIIQIPITIATSFILLNALGLSSNIMSLTGIALAIGVIVDNGIIMSENA